MKPRIALSDPFTLSWRWKTEHVVGPRSEREVIGPRWPQIGLLTSGRDWAVAGAVVLVACAGKLGGCSLAARLTGHSRRDALALGVLMNTRGLMELVVLNIGLGLGVISPTVFSMMVIMALVTTCVAGPLVRWFPPST